MIIASKINNKIIDLHGKQPQDINTITRNSEEGEELLRHSAAHVLGEVLNHKYKNIYFATGPVTEFGFYYDVLMNGTLSVNDLPHIENLMKESIREKKNFLKENITKQKAIELFEKDPCKSLILKKIPDGEDISIYTYGNFRDLCGGPHVVNGHIIGEDFKLTKVSQVTWNGLLLQRVEGILFFSKERLNKHLEYMEKKNSIDHRKIGEECELFQHLSISQGNVFWLENGRRLFKTICDYLEEKYIKFNYKIVKTPLLFQNDLWKTTGHWDKYRENMYITQDNEVVKPMNCPGHVEIFKIFSASYKELPIRLGEIAHVHRKEETGALNGLKRACGFHQDDGHIFCTLDEVEKEIELFMLMLDEIYKDFGFETYEIVLSTRPNNRIGEDDRWNQSEGILIKWLKDNNKTFRIAEGDGAFYGPKIEIQLKDNFMRKWTCATLQWDDFLPQRLEAKYNSYDNEKLYPIMLHRAILGSIERFIAILLEHYEGHLPLWITPVQVLVISVSEKTSQYAEGIHELLLLKNLKSTLDISNNTLNSKLKKCLQKKIPYVVIIGAKEVEENIITVRNKNINTSMKIEQFIKTLECKIAEKK
jgi:threonyl-tRNA synthetase